MNTINFIDKDAGLAELQLFSSHDIRGHFVKAFTTSNLATLLPEQIEFIQRETYFSYSFPGVLRGMHLQVGDYSNYKIVTCLSGSVLDVCIDLRHDRSTYGNCYSLTLSYETNNAILVPPGFGHGFLNHTNVISVVLYCVSSQYNKINDTGVRWDSIDFNWGITNPVISPRDANLPSLNEFKYYAYPY